MKGYKVFKALGDKKFCEWTIKVGMKVEINLRNANLRWANLRWANLSKADLSKADLREADLSEADLSKADLSKADLSKADLRGADLRWADLSKADLSKADLREADLSKADLSKADLREADLDFSAWPLWCGSVGSKSGDRLAAQLIWHVGKLDTENCSQMMKDAVQHIRDMAASDVFSDEYRTELEGQEAEDD